MKYSLYLLVFLLVSCKCHQKETSTAVDIGTIIYESRGAALAPEHHRTYRLEVHPDNIAVNVRSYSTVITDTVIPISESQFREIADTYLSLNLKKSTSYENIGCVGGTGAWIEVRGTNNKELISGKVNFCGGAAYGEIEGDVRQLDEKIRSMIPGFETLMKRDWVPDDQNENDSE